MCRPAPASTPKCAAAVTSVLAWTKTEISHGLYPKAPDPTKTGDLTPAQQFWVIKHGVKLSAMPAWGKTHSDALIWDMVAFLQKLPAMAPARYKATVASAPADHDKMMKDMH